MKRYLFLLAAAAPLLGQPCSYSVSPTAITVTANGGGNNITVSTNSGTCSWGYSTDSPTWISLSATGSANNSVTGSGVLTVTALASSLPTARTGNVNIQFGGGSQNIAVTQGPAQCSMTLQPASATLPVSGGTNSFSVQTSCTWAAQSNTLWITVGSPAGSGSATTGPPTVTGTGNGTVPYTAAPNTCVNPQTGTIIVTSQPNQTFTVTESGSPNNLTLSPTSLSAPQAGTSGHLNVITGDPCAWSSFSDVGWIHINTTPTGTGNGGLGYTIDANSGSPRNGNIHVGAQLFAVAQAGIAIPAVQLTSVNNAASYATGSVAPGEIVTVFGSNIGPSPADGLQFTSSSKQSITTSLGGAQVLFDGNPAPLTYASATQINAIAPVGLAGKASTQVQVSYQGSMSNTITIPVAAAAPGIFAADSSGMGGGAILNQDYSLNARLNPAARGSVIAIYLTGSGATNPEATDGAITGTTPPFPSVAQTVAVTIGGVSVPAAQVVYGGAAPGFVEGLTQVDAYVPQSVTPGPAVPVVVTIGGVASQAGITLSVN